MGTCSDVKPPLQCGRVVSFDWFWSTNFGGIATCFWGGGMELIPWYTRGGVGGGGLGSTCDVV